MAADRGPGDFGALTHKTKLSMWCTIDEEGYEGGNIC